MSEAPAESLPPLDAGYYLAMRFEYYPRVLEFNGAEWLDEAYERWNDPRLAGWTLTPVAAIEKLTDERGRIALALSSWRSDMETAGKVCGQRDEEYSLAAVQRVVAERDKALADLATLRHELDVATRTRADLGTAYKNTLADLVAVTAELEHYRKMEAKTYADLVQSRNETLAARAELARVRVALADPTLEELREFVSRTNHGANYTGLMSSACRRVTELFQARRAALTTPPAGSSE